MTIETWTAAWAVVVIVDTNGVGIGATAAAVVMGTQTGSKSPLIGQR